MKHKTAPFSSIQRILITNDDGIFADGLLRLVAAAKDFGEVWVVAPDGQRSAASHSITLRHPVDLIPVNDYPVEGVHAFSCSGTPADCVRVGGLYLMKGMPDIVLSGINYGYNVASDIQYSATVGAALEGAFQGWPSIALSEGCKNHEVTDAYLYEVLGEYIDRKPPSGNIWNMNFPDCSLKECKGILHNTRVSAGTFYRDHYNEIAMLETGGVRLMVEGVYNEQCEEQTDFRAVVDGFISIGLVNNLGYPVSLADLVQKGKGEN